MTTWHPHVHPDPHEYLLTNGEIVTAPAMEISGGGRRIRLAADHSLSMSAKDEDRLMALGAKHIARTKGEDVWMRVQRDVRRHVFGGGDLPTPTLQPPQHNSSTLWWQFRHDTLPIEALITIRHNRSWRNTSLNIDVTVPITMPMHNHGSPWISINALSSTTDSLARRKMIDDALLAPPLSDMAALAARHETFGDGSRAVYGTLLEVAEQIDGMTRLPVPDLRGDTPEVMWLDFVDGNYSGEYRQSLIDLIDGQPLLDKAVALYDQLRQVLGQMGIVVGGDNENAFREALSGGDEIVSVPVNPLQSDEHTVDTDHVLHVHPITGTFHVQCSTRNDHAEVVDRWEEARTMASLTGEEDTLLAFAREYAKRHGSQQARRIAEARDPR